ncbi:nitrate ABC transporter ATP-binding protein [Tistrella bauzanensis]|uniref:Nitrate ABC transporter ATP-binding protein n=1 Tax=Tistrella bauzanensis TaxID=657419 RepID=A0ABQ1I972_9PROT|nr:ABC transporter ATP-binding protein [Tistrella bauzanensis]GGB25136.1 nitrate ABC transporter ATP-binding protein [Tistrella bauzanensis]
MSTTHLSIEGVDLDFTTRDGVRPVLRGIDLKVARGEFVAVIGHSGCGKSTLLNIVAGLITPDRGAILVDGKLVDEPGPDRAMVFQSHALLPWLTVHENVALAVDQVHRKAMDQAARTRLVDDHLALVRMDHAARRFPHELSGGMRQRVGIARALAMRPAVLLMDEPFGALDALTRARLQDELMAIQADLKMTVMMVTHDVDEAALLADRVVMMSEGPGARIGQIVDIPLSRPRKRARVLRDPVFIEARVQMLSFLQGDEPEPDVDSDADDMVADLLPVAAE